VFVRAMDTAVAGEFAGAAPLQWSARMADSEIGRRGESLIFKEGGSTKWDYTVGLFTLSLVRLGETLNEPRYGKFAESVIGSFITADGQIHGYRVEDYNLDSINSGRALPAGRGPPAEAIRDPTSHQRRRFLAQAALSQADVARRRVYGRAVLCRVRAAVQGARHFVR
jgi:unsaturated rhamnogalacturonyl hydrolase